MSDVPVIAVTAGCPAGVGPDICLSLAKQNLPVAIVIIANRTLLAERAELLGQRITLLPYIKNAVRSHQAGTLVVVDTPLAEPVIAGQGQAAHATYVLATLERAITGCSEGEFAALVTCPVNKAMINESGHSFSGHTEYFAQACGVRRVVMLLVHQKLRVALATTHIPLRDVASSITHTLLYDTITILHRELQQHFGITQPTIFVAGLNPHAGEGGHLGREEIDIIMPCIRDCRAQEINVSGPYSADTIFTPHITAKCDAILAMYHDQGLPVLKYAGFGNAVNITLGLPFIRTSVDHGTAYDIAGTGRADPGSLHTALLTAIEMMSYDRIASSA